MALIVSAKNFSDTFVGLAPLLSRWSLFESANVNESHYAVSLLCRIIIFLIALGLIKDGARHEIILRCTDAFAVRGDLHSDRANFVKGISLRPDAAEL